MITFDFPGGFSSKCLPCGRSCATFK